MPSRIATCFLGLVIVSTAAARADERIQETDAEIRIALPQLDAVIRKEGYVTGVKAQSFLDKKTGFRDAGFGLDIVERLPI